MSRKILIIDGTYLAYRSYFAMNKSNVVLTNDEGFSTNTILLFFRTLFNLIVDQGPSHIFIAFDAKEKTFRHEMYDHYKEGRIKMPSEFFAQMNLIKELLKSVNIQNLEKPGYEADDIIAKVCLKHHEMEKVIFSADQDLNQLIDDHTKIVKKHKDSIHILTKDNFKTIYDFEPYQVVDYKAIVGDSSDNFFGIKGIGPKTAAKLLNEYKTLDNIYNNLENIKPTWASKFEEFRDIAFRDQKIARLATDFELDNIDLSDIDINNLSMSDKAIEIIDRFQLNSIRKNFIKLIKK
ncbi:5'-3' exonuclease [Mycoplasmopsis arginini]|uniref:5'-3' exonuclease n=1 Tax=Mycoplasmopsis arginini TaxID=2094 RepID=UPI0005C26AB0|nr:5'-3' exonuclease H3TH domain-containing protein [Mycoplasmopsis arginini]BAQ54395.1 DNA polymerase I 5'-3' exonuclease domain protein [Mycoplasmopsis arginini]